MEGVKIKYHLCNALRYTKQINDAFEKVPKDIILRERYLFKKKEMLSFMQELSSDICLNFMQKVRLKFLSQERCVPLY